MSESRIELITWLNDLLQLNITKIEHVGQGAIPCQVLDSIWKDIPLHRVKFSASHEYEYIANFKIFQAALINHGNSKEVPVERLVKLRFQDNLEFLQWLKKLWDSSYQGNYDAIARRQAVSLTAKNNITGQPGADNSAAKQQIKTSSMQSSSSPVKTVATRKNSATSPLPHNRSSTSATCTVINLQNDPVISNLKREVTELKVCIDRIEKERDFYFAKLREVEILCQQSEKNEFFEKVLEILYATEGDAEIETSV